MLLEERRSLELRRGTGGSGSIAVFFEVEIVALGPVESVRQCSVPGLGPYSLEEGVLLPVQSSLGETIVIWCGRPWLITALLLGL